MYDLASLYHLPRFIVFLDEPVGDRSIVRDSGNSVNFSCRADGMPLPTIVWLKDRNLILDSGVKFQIISNSAAEGLRPNLMESVSSVLTIMDLSPRDSGNYTCRAFNFISSAILSQPFSLTVLPPPLPDICASNPCQNGGVCIPGLTFLLCECLDGITCSSMGNN